MNSTIEKILVTIGAALSDSLEIVEKENITGPLKALTVLCYFPYQVIEGIHSEYELKKQVAKDLSSSKFSNS